MTGRIKKYKARCNIDGSRQVYGRDYDQTYAPVASWNSVRMLLAMTLLHRWHTQQLDYVLAYPQARVERDLYMNLPKGYKIDGVTNSNEYVLKIHKNIYGQKQAGRVWYLHLVKKLEQVGFVKSEIDECVFYKGNMLYVLYTDDSILAGPDQKEIDKTIQQMKKVGLDITIEGTLNDFLGVNIDRHESGTITLSQPRLIDQILADTRLNGDDVKTKATPAPSSRILSRHLDSEPFDNSFHYRSVIGKLNYLERGSRPDIAFATHTCARFSSNPREEHGKAVRWLVRYLKGTRDKGLELKPDATKSLEVHVDSDFAGAWDPKVATIDRDTARSRHGYVITFAGIPISWKSQLQTEIALSTTEAEVTGLSYALREAIPIIELLKEMQRKGFDVNPATPKIHCRVFEDNSGAIEIASFPKARPRTKHLNNRLWHFRSYVDNGEITIRHIKSEDQRADILNKSVNQNLFEKHRLVIMGW